MAYCGRLENHAILTLQIAFTHARRVGSQHSFGLPRLYFLALFGAFFLKVLLE